MASCLAFPISQKIQLKNSVKWAFPENCHWSLVKQKSTVTAGINKSKYAHAQYFHACHLSYFLLVFTENLEDEARQSMTTVNSNITASLWLACITFYTKGISSLSQPFTAEPLFTHHTFMGRVSTTNKSSFWGNGGEKNRSFCSVEIKCSGRKWVTWIMMKSCLALMRKSGQREKLAANRMLNKTLISGDSGWQSVRIMCVYSCTHQITSK